MANAYAAMEHNLTIVPVLNKVDLKHARPDEVKAEMESVLGIDPDEVIAVQRQDRRRSRGAAGGDRRAGSAPHGRSRRRRCKRWCSIRTTTNSAARSPTSGS